MQIMDSQNIVNVEMRRNSKWRSIDSNNIIQYKNSKSNLGRFFIEKSKNPGSWKRRTVTETSNMSPLQKYINQNN